MHHPLTSNKVGLEVGPEVYSADFMCNMYVASLRVVSGTMWQSALQFIEAPQEGPFSFRGIR